MMDLSSVVCFILAFCASCFPWTAGKSESERLLVFLLDGFRYDYLNQSSLPLPGFNKLTRMGVKAEGLVPDFPSLSYPNYYSLMTGLHTESHGMTGNFMYDVSREEYFLIGVNPEQFHAHWWNRAEPLWIGAVRQNLTSHMYHWPGCEVEIRGLRPSFCRPYSGIPTFADLQDAINQSLELLRTKETNLAGIYFEQTDSVGHASGPFTDDLNNVIRALDLVMSDLIDRLSDPDLADVNVVIFSDHGMTEVSTSRIIEIWKVLDASDDVMTISSGAVVGLYPGEGKEQQVYDKLKNFHPNMTVYRRSNLPDRWHYKHGPYVAPLTAVADLGWYIITPQIRYKNHTYKGYHGYDPRHSDMQGIFLAMGPAFTPGAKVERLHAVDIYQIMCDILGIDSAPNNGSLNDVTPLLAASASTSVTSNAIYVITLAASILSLLCCYL